MENNLKVGDQVAYVPSYLLRDGMLPDFNNSNVEFGFLVGRQPDRKGWLCHFWQHNHVGQYLRTRANSELCSEKNLYLFMHPAVTSGRILRILKVLRGEHTQKSAEVFRQRVNDLAIKEWEVSHCSICGYPFRYLFKGNEVWWDPGCHCKTKSYEPLTWRDVATYYNMKSAPDIIAEMDEFWKFD